MKAEKNHMPFSAKGGLRCLVLSFLSLMLAGCASLPASPVFTSQPLPSRLIELGSCSILERSNSKSRREGGAIRFVFIGGVLGPGKIFEPLAEHLGKGISATTIAIDLPGMGGSRLHDAAYTWSNQRACLEEYLQSQPAFILVVHDVAGPVVLPLLPRLGKLRGVVIMNTVFDTGNLSSPFPLNWIRAAGPFAKPMAYTMNYPFYRVRVRQMGIARVEQVPEAFLRDVYGEITADGGKGRLADVLRAFEPGEETDLAIRNGLEVSQPQLFIWGKADPALGREIDKLSPVRGNQRVVSLIGAKHFLMMDYPGEIADIIIDWLREAPMSP